MNVDLARSLWRYDPETGVLYWAVFASSRATVGSPAGCLDSEGYVIVGYAGRRYKAHRLIWLIVTGEFPPEEIDHINRNPSDNRLSNLRCVTRKQNNENLASRREASFRGVHWFPRTSKWVVKFTHLGKRRSLGYFDSLLDAVAIRIRAERESYTHSVFSPGSQP